MVHAITSLKIVLLEIVTFNNGVPKCTALLHGKAVNNVPILIDDGQLSSTSLTHTWFTPGIPDSPVLNLIAEPHPAMKIMWFM